MVRDQAGIKDMRLNILKTLWNSSLCMLLLALFVGGIFVGARVADAQDAAPEREANTEDVAGTLLQDIDEILPQVSRQINAALMVSNSADTTVFNDLTVGEGERMDGNVVVYDGDVHVRGGGQITGDLVVYNGDIRVDEGGSISGNTSTFSGDIRISGNIGGNLTTWNGDVDLRDSAVIGGDVSVLSGDVQRADGAKIGGNIVRGPNLELPEVPKAPFNFSAPQGNATDAVAKQAPSFFLRFGMFILRSFGMMLLAVIAGLVIWLITQLRPETVKRTQSTLTSQAAISFVVGIVINVVLLLVGGFFAVTFCLLPVALLAYALLFGANVVGWAGLSAVISNRIMKRWEIDAPWEQVTAVVGMLIAAVFGLLWAFGGCFRFFGFAGMLIASSIGAGAVLMPFMHKHLGLGSDGTSSTTDVELAQSDYVVDRSQTTAVDLGATERTQTDKLSLSSEMVTDAELEDLLRINGLGPVAAERLYSAGITGVSAVAEMTPEAVGEILRWSPDRVQQARIIEQARELSQLS